MIMRIVFGMILVTWVALSCQSKRMTETVEVDTTPPKPVIQMSLSGCFGTCPVYDLTLYDDHTWIYHGKKYVDKEGIYSKEISQSIYDRWVEIFTDSGFLTLEDRYNSLLMDAPSTTIRFIHGKMDKTVKSKSEGPEIFQDLAIQLQDVATSEGWEKLSLPHDNSKSLNQIIVQLIPQAKATDLLDNLPDYGLAVEKLISKHLNYWLYTYDPNKVTESTLLEVLINDELVVLAEPNKEVKLTR